MVMDALVPLGVVVLAALIHSTFQLGLGALLLLYHASLGKHIYRRTLKLVSAFTAGFAVMILLMLAAACFFIWAICGRSLPFWGTAVLVALLAVLAVAVWLLYYRRGRATELWLPKSIARYIDRRAKLTESTTEAFSLGLLACFGEFPFTLVLIITAASGVLEFTTSFRAPVVALYTIIAVLPLVVMRLTIRRGATVVEVQKWRVKHKLFLRAISGLGLVVLAIFLLTFKIMVDLN